MANRDHTKGQDAAAKADVRHSWIAEWLTQSRALVVMIGSYLGAVSGMIIFERKWLTAGTEDSALFWKSVAGPLLIILVFWQLPRLFSQWLKTRRKKIALKEVDDKDKNAYFRLTPYTTGNADEFKREDGVHEEVLQWVLHSACPVLFLVGMSGAGKSSVLQGFLRPKLIAAPARWNVIEVKNRADPSPELEAALATPRAKAKWLLIIIDQFEEFAILEEEESTESRRQFIHRIRALAHAPPPNFRILLAFRADYRNKILKLKLEETNSLDAWMEIERFTAGAAKNFLRSAPQGPSEALTKRLLAAADTVEDPQGYYRPVVLNMLGVALKNFTTEFTGRPDRLIRDYFAESISEISIRGIARGVIEKMIAGATVRKMVSVADLSAQCGLRSEDVLSCLLKLQEKGLARPLGNAGSHWELNHDFVAHQFALLFGYQRPSSLPMLANAAVLVLFVVLLAGIAGGLPIYFDYRAGNTVSITMDNGLRTATFPKTTDDTAFRQELPYLAIKDVQVLDLSDNESLTSLPNLLSLPDLKVIDLYGSAIKSIAELNGLDQLAALDLGGSDLVTLPTLQDLPALATLDLSFTDSLTTVALQNLPSLETIDLYDSKILSLPELSGLRKLMTLELSGTSNLSTLAPLQDLPNLKEIDLEGSGIASIGTIIGLTSLTALDLESTESLRTLSSLQDLPNLQEIDLDDSGIASIGTITGLHSLTTLGLELTSRLTTLSLLQDLPNLQEIDLDASGIASIGTLTGLPNVTTLELDETVDLKTLPSLQNLPALREIDLFDSGVTSLQQVNGLHLLQTLSVQASSHLATLASLYDLPALQYLDLSGSGIKSVPDLNGLHRLQTLDLNLCNIETLPELHGHDLPELRDIDLSYSSIRRLPALDDLPDLETLELAYTGLLTKFPQMESLASLKEIDLTGSGVKSIPNWPWLNKVKIIQ